MTAIFEATTKKDVVFVAITHPDGMARVHPGGDTVFGPGDVLIVAGDQAGISRISAKHIAVKFENTCTKTLLFASVYARFA
ncbi:MAG: TrkA C-terminal domain-containing protein [Candidatus Eisenbacteria sp.]|nr:TrkA C-terminal domain-containing protein [Candidatus Eisenbacteria bacterium]